MKQKILLLLLITFLSFTDVFSQLRDSVLVETPIFTVMYSETKEQPLWVEYNVKPIQKGADRKGMNFYKETDYHTSVNNDYLRNEWDKGHMAPAAHFSDTEENLRQTFTYLNSALQQQYLNRGEWRLLEEQERKWSEIFGELFVRIDIIFDDVPQVLSTGAEIPDGFVKKIHFTQTSEWKCFYFTNTKPTKKWDDHQINCD